MSGTIYKLAFGLFGCLFGPTTLITGSVPAWMALLVLIGGCVQISFGIVDVAQINFRKPKV